MLNEANGYQFYMTAEQLAYTLDLYVILLGYDIFVAWILHSYNP